MLGFKKFSALGVPVALAITALSVSPKQAMAQDGAVGSVGTGAATTATGSQACAAIVNGAAAGLAGRIQADNVTILAPVSVNKLSCLGSIFGNGIGLDLVQSLLNPGKIVDTIETQLANQVCSLAASAWQEVLGSLQCGLTLTGFNTGFGLGLGGGLLCPKLSFGGGGPSLGTLGTGLNGAQSYGIYTNGQPGIPTGYPVPTAGGFY